MNVQRLCSKTACGRPAVATLTYVYADSMVVLGALATHAEPHSYDLCADHAERLTVPKGWEVVRLVEEFVQPPAGPDDLVALADAVHGHRSHAEQAAPEAPAATAPAPAPAPAPGPRPQEVSTVQVGRRAHLRLLPTDDES